MITNELYNELQTIFVIVVHSRCSINQYHYFRDAVVFSLVIFYFPKQAKVYQWHKCDQFFGKGGI